MDGSSGVTLLGNIANQNGFLSKNGGQGIHVSSDGSTTTSDIVLQNNNVAGTNGTAVSITDTLNTQVRTFNPDFVQQNQRACLSH
jgi:hypothetical protein